MSKQIRRILIGLGIVLVCLTGLIAASALVPDVGCESRPSHYFDIYTTIQLSAPEKVGPGETFRVSGTLYKIIGSNPLSTRYQPFPQQQISINAAMFTAVDFTDDSGNFTADFTVKTPGIYKITAYYAGDRLLYYVDSGAEQYITIVGLASKPVDYRWMLYVMIIIGSAIAGYILLYRLQRSKETKRILINVKSLAGQRRPFRLSPWLTALLTITIIFGIFFALWPRQQKTVRHEFVPVYIETRTKLEAPVRVKPGQEFIIKGELTGFENGIESPLSSQPVHIFNSPKLGISTEITQVLTDTYGNFSATIVLEKAGTFEIAAVFNDTGDLYYESSDSRDVVVGNFPVSPFSDWNSPGWLAIIIGIPLVTLVAIFTIHYYRRYRKNRSLTEKTSKQVPVKSPPTTTPRPVLSKHETSLHISFPQITGEFPDVWGHDEDFSIVVRKLIENNRTRVDIELEPDIKRETDLNKDGYISQKHIYKDTGEYEVKAAFTGKPFNGYRPASRYLRIVDYREEIVRLYNDMFTSLINGGIALTPKMTVREVKYRLHNSFAKLPDDITHSFVSIFEEADYSLHPISRSEYEEMYLITREVNKYVRK